MRTIDILTSQNVTINYELAGLRERIFAWIIDMILIVILLLILRLIVYVAGMQEIEKYFEVFVILPIYVFYHLICEMLMDGQSPGKKALELKIVKLTGTEPSPTNYFIRWAFRPIDILFSLGSVGMMLISSSEKAQRLGDVVANTAVVKLSPSQSIKLHDILNIRSLENYEPVYPQVGQLAEADMLLLKEVMERNFKYPNTAHHEAMEEVVELVRDKLNIMQIPYDRIVFIRTLIKDYVAMSR